MTKRHRKRPTSREAEFVERLVERAKRMDARKHHLVPAWYLSAWEVDGALGATNIGSRKQHHSSARDVAWLRDYYRVEAPELDPEEVPPLIFEALLGEIEGLAAASSRELLMNGVSSLSMESRTHLALFIAFQLLRGQDYRASMQALARNSIQMMASHWDDAATRNSLRERMGSEPSDQAVDDFRSVVDQFVRGEIVAMAPNAMLIGLAGELAFEMLPYVAGRQWVLVEGSGNFLTCDEPVITLGGPPYRRTDSVGVETAGVIVIPMSPKHLLVMFHPLIGLPEEATKQRLWFDEEAEINREVAANARRWIFERPSTTQGRVVSVPDRSPAPAMDGPRRIKTRTGEGVVYRSGARNRWSSTSNPPPWPVGRWWAGTNGKWADYVNALLRNVRAFQDPDVVFERISDPTTRKQGTNPPPRGKSGSTRSRPR